MFKPITGAAAATAAGVLLLAGCTSTGPSDSQPQSAISPGASHTATTVTVWTFNHLPNEVAAFKATLNRLHTKYPWLTVKFVPNKDDAAYAKAVAAGDPPDVFISSVPDNVAKFCYNGTVADVGPYLTSAKSTQRRPSRPRPWPTPVTRASSARCRC
ncbi:hypothetical protein AB0L66_21570 [Streptomyces sp. NPDC052207]|uniref:hypothetical protein n=1 Tax=Streptomyces sp. NPDC052207 TaxID=3155418 RepID=UPI0034344C44